MAQVLKLIIAYKIFLYLALTLLVGFSFAGLWLAFNLRRERYLAAQVGDLAKQPEFKRYRYTGPVFVLILSLLAAAFIYGADFTGKSSFCANCHEMKPFYKSWRSSKHKKVSCLTCHQEPGSLGFIIAKAEGLRNYSLRSIYFGRFRPPLAFISNKVCLQCHQDLADKVVVSSNIRVSHKEFISNFNCSSCHSKIGHTYVSQKTKQPVMDKCLFCHRSYEAKASARCNVCHLKDVGYRPGQLDDYQLVDFSDEACQACHSKPANSP